MTKEQTIPEQKPLFANFAEIGQALDFRSKHGGWLFVHDDKSGATWFDLQFTASGVMKHFAATGNGELIMRKKMDMRVYRRNIKAACAALGNRIPNGYSTSIATNGDFIVYSSGMNIVGRLDKWEPF